MVTELVKGRQIEEPLALFVAPFEMRGALGRLDTLHQAFRQM
jgi:hypothetical protein